MTVASTSLRVRKAPLSLTSCSRIPTPPPSSSDSLGYWKRMSWDTKKALLFDVIQNPSHRAPLPFPIK